MLQYQDKKTWFLRSQTRNVGGRHHTENEKWAVRKGQKHEHGNLSKLLTCIIGNIQCLFGFKLLWRLRFCSAVFSSFFLVQPAFVDFFTVNSASVHCSRIHKFHFSVTVSLKIGPTILFIHLKIILLQCFQFSVFSFSKISSIQTYSQSKKFWGNKQQRFG